MPNSGPKSHKNSQTTGNSKTIWIILPILLLFVSITSFLAGTHIGRATDHRLGQMLDTIVLSPENEAVNRLQRTDLLHRRFALCKPGNRATQRPQANHHGFGRGFSF